MDLFFNSFRIALKTLFLSTLVISYLVIPYLPIVIGNFSMLSGMRSSTVILSKLTSMEWCSPVAMGFSGAYIPGSLHILRIIQRSQCIFYAQLTCLLSSQYNWNRVLIANIRNLGSCPCPRCLIPKNHLHNLATKKDIVQRRILTRRDTKERRLKVTTSRQLIYDKGYVVGTPQVEALLKEESLVPTMVRSSRWLINSTFNDNHIRMHSQSV